MQSTQGFSGLTMPVFTAFGWAGEENALKYALSQLELFVGLLHTKLHPLLRAQLPEYGLSQESQTVYLAASPEVESDVHVAFYARPLSFETQLALTDKTALNKAWRQISKDPAAFRQMLVRLGPGWNLRVQQIHVNEETGDQGHYQDLFKDEVTTLDEATSVELVEKAAYLNGEDKWIVPIYVSQRLPAEQIAAMGEAVTSVLAERLEGLLPLIQVMRGQTPRRKAAAAAKSRARARAAKAQATQAPAVPVAPPVKEGAEEFSYVSELKPLHLRKGFVNLTPQHWTFFALTARTETRPVTVVIGGDKDKGSAVWRLQPSGIARLVLSPRVHRWLEDNFVPEEQVRVSAQKLADDEIQIKLDHA